VRQALIELSVEGLRVGGDVFARVAGERVSDVSSSIPLSDEQVFAVLRSATELGGQHRTAVLLVAVMGLRSFEAGQVTAQSVKPSPWGLVAEITGKGGKRALVPVPGIVSDSAAVAGWPMDGRRGSGRERVRYLIRLSAEAAGVTVSPHQFRHWHATTALNAGVPLHVVQDSLRHTDPATTQRYNRARHLAENQTSTVLADIIVRGASAAP
jgi:integrase